MRRALAALVLIAVGCESAAAHDIPNARVDRSIQAVLAPGRLRVDYEVSLAELTLVQDLRQLVGELPGADRRGWFEAYGREVGPLNARGFLVAVDGSEVDLRATGFELAIEGHPRYTFHFEAEVPVRGRLALNDSNYAGSEGTSRLALRAEGGLVVRGDDLPTDVAAIPTRPVWQLSDAEEKRTRRLTVDYGPGTSPARVALPPREAPPSRPAEGLGWLLDDARGGAWPALLLLAFGLGAAHAIQPGHGKTLVAAASLGEGSGPIRGAALGLLTAAFHLASVGLIAALAWATRATRMAEAHLVIGRVSGFAIAAVGLWRVGRHLADYGEHDGEWNEAATSRRGLVVLALAGGAVPCWDAVALVVVAAALGRLASGLGLLVAFSLGMAAVLVGVGLLAGRFRSALGGWDQGGAWARRLGVAGGLVLTALGLALLR